MRKDLRYRLRSFEFRRCGRVEKKESPLFEDLPWCEMCRSLHKTFIHLRHHENGQKLAGNVAFSSI